MKLLDPITSNMRAVEPHDGKVSIYVCGITPYDSSHLGHAFTYHVFDVLGRRLRSDGIATQTVRNLTDIDNEMVRVAKERGENYLDIGNREAADFERAMAAINIKPVDATPRATEYIERMVDWIARLVAADIAYVRDGWVYFDISRFPDYGDLCKLDRQAMITISRERGGDPDDIRKRDSLDFVLWQQGEPDDPSWESPWGKGRPGWHIECTVMASSEIGAPVDIHGGGSDLIYPHHESEIAQYTALTGAEFVKHWMHAGMVEYQGEKMSKSLGNLVFIRDLVPNHDPAAIRLMLAQHHYASSWEYRASDLSVAEARLEKCRAAISSGATLDASLAARFTSRFNQCLDDNLDTPGALGVLDQATEALAANSQAQGALARDLLGPMLDLLGAAAADA